MRTATTSICQLFVTQLTQLFDKISDLSESIPSKAMFAEQQRWRQGAGHPEALQRTFDKVPFGRLGHRSQIRWFWTKRDLMIWEDV